MMAAEQDLDALVRRYRTDNGRRRRIFVAATPLGAVAGCLGILVILIVGRAAQARL